MKDAGFIYTRLKLLLYPHLQPVSILPLDPSFSLNALRRLHCSLFSVDQP
jgi:hypothetical protein